LFGCKYSIVEIVVGNSFTRFKIHTQQTSARSKDELEQNVRSHLRILQSDSAKITSFFHAPLTKYAAL
jgi:hypothetical protein